MIKKFALLILLIPTVCLAGITQQMTALLSKATTPSCSGTYGTTSGGSTSAVSSYIIRLVKVAVDCTGSTFSIKARLQDVNNEFREVIFLLYDDDGGSGEPGTLLYNSTSAFSDGTTSGAFQTVVDSSGSAAITPGDYWAGVFYEDTASDFEYDGTGGDTRKWVQGGFGVGSIPSPWVPASDDHSSTAKDAYYLEF